MNSYLVEMNYNLAAVYYNKGKSNLLRINIDVTLCNLKHQLDQLNGCINYDNARRVAGVEYRHPSVNSYERFRLTNMKLQNDDDVNTKFFIFSQ
ncbi:hypothetical protein A2U01_0011983 [Trifolium medium]|uniref:Uncharacterized protein n=1 Tax=Trifolium medium TaxID=97028 RepID=A0A392MVS4_9FABA|nr:hypothetical protein [Trifolium medium]